MEPIADPPPTPAIETPAISVESVPAAPLSSSTSVESPILHASADVAPDELNVPFLTVLAIAVVHALGLVVLETMTSTSAFRSSATSGTLFAMFLVVLFVIPGALTGWFVRGSSLSFKRWLVLAGSEWLLAGTAVCLAVALKPVLAHSTQLQVIGVPLFGCLALAVTLLVTQTRRNRLAKPYPVYGRRRHINMSMPSVPVGDLGVKGVQASTYTRSTSEGSMHHGAVHAGHMPLRQPDEPDNASATLPFHALIAIAVPHAMLLLTIEVMTRDCAWRTNTEIGTFFGVALAIGFVVPGAWSGWFLRGRDFSFKRWLLLAGTEWLFAGVSGLVAVVSGLTRLLDGGDWGTVVFFGIPVFAALLLLAVLGMTQTRRKM